MLKALLHLMNRLFVIILSRPPPIRIAVAMSEKTLQEMSADEKQSSR